MKSSLIPLLAALSSHLCLSLAYNTESSATTCATAYVFYSKNAPKSVPTTTYHKRTYTTATITHTFHPVTKTTPTSTSTVSDTVTSTTTETLAAVTDTFSTTTTFTETDTETDTATTTDTTTVTTTITSTSTNTVQPSPGFQPINPGASKEKRSSPDRVERAAPRAEILPAAAPSSARGGKRHYPKSVICDVVTTYSTRTATTVTAASTRTRTAPTTVVTTTVTSTATSTSFVADPVVSTTSTFSTTETDTTTTTTTSTVSETSTTTDTAQATATYYAACAPNNKLVSDDNNYFASSGETYSTVYGRGSAYNCCAACIADGTANCAISYYAPAFDQCTFIDDNMCSTSNGAGFYSTDQPRGQYEIDLMNSNCGIWQQISF